jgi:hypothetical protein
MYGRQGTLIFYIGNHVKSWLNSRLLLEVPKDNKTIGVADPIIATKYTACHHDKDGKIEYWQGVPKAQEMRCTASPYMHKEEVRHISRAFGSCIGDGVVASFTR